MSSATICGCGIPFQVRASKSGEPPRCPMCGRRLKTSSRSVKIPRQSDSPLYARLKIGVGVASLVGLVLLAVILLTPGVLTPRPTARVNLTAPSEIAPPPGVTEAVAPPPSRSRVLDGTMIPTGPSTRGRDGREAFSQGPL